MIQIKKSIPPKVLVDYKRNKDATYDAFNGKSTLADALIKEQFGLCAYCMSRISNQVTYKNSFRITHCKIEHFKSQSKYPDLQLEYSNMLGCCNGNEGQPSKFQTCDTHKKNKELLFNPSNENDCKKMDIKFYKDGTIHSGNKEFDNQLNTILNLNAPHLVSERKALLMAAFNILSKKKVSIPKLIKNYSSLENGLHKPYYYVVVYYLQKHLTHK